MAFTASITRRERKRRLTSGVEVMHTRWVVNYRDPRVGRRRQLFFERHKDALAKRDALVASAAAGACTEAEVVLAVAQAVEHWLDHRRPEVKYVTFKS